MENSDPAVFAHVQSQSGQDERPGEDSMPYDIDWETACNDFHPAFALVRGERFVPDAKPIRRKSVVPLAPRRDRGIAHSSSEPGMKAMRLGPAVLNLPEFSR
jgi:hypothetical protein